MASLKDLRNRIASVKSTQKITKAMQMVSAAKLRRAQEAAEAARPYAGRMAAVMANLSNSMAGSPGASPLLVGTGSDETRLLLVMAASTPISPAWHGLVSTSCSAPARPSRSSASARRAMIS